MSDLPPGFVLDNQPQGPPPGFVLDAAASSKPIGAAMAIPSPPIAAPPGSLAVPPRQPVPPTRPWGDVAVDAVKNLPSSLWSDVAVPTFNALTHPVDTAKGIGSLVGGLAAQTVDPEIAGSINMQRIVNPEGADANEQALNAYREKSRAPLNAIASDYASAYGSEAGLKDTLANHPGRVLMDAATVATPFKGGALIDPLTQTGNALKLAGKGAEATASNVLGMTTGAGTQSIRAAGRAGLEGGEAGAVLRENMRGQVPVSDIVDRAKEAVTQLRQDRSDAYKAGKHDLAQDTSIIPFADIDTAVDKASKVGTFKGQTGTAPAVTIEPAAAETVDRMKGLVNAWKALDPTEYHTPVGIDALKRALGNIRDSTGPYTPERVAADRIYNAVRDEVAAQAPGYSKMMEGYSRASDTINEATRTLSLGEKASVDTASRKLLSATRNNVQTNYGERGRLLDVLAEKDPQLPTAIAGQSLNALAPRGLVGRGGLLAAGGSVLSNPMNALMLPAFSPRIVGETVHLGGRAVGTVDDVANALHITPENLRRAYKAGYVGSQPNNAGQ